MPTSNQRRNLNEDYLQNNNNSFFLGECEVNKEYHCLNLHRSFPVIWRCRWCGLNMKQQEKGVPFISSDVFILSRWEIFLCKLISIHNNSNSHRMELRRKKKKVLLISRCTKASLFSRSPSPWNRFYDTDLIFLPNSIPERVGWFCISLHSLVQHLVVVIVVGFIHEKILL